MRIAFLALLACGSNQPAASEPAHEPEPSAQPQPADDPVECASAVAESSFERAVDGAHRACRSDADCVSVRLDCSNLRCTAVHASHRDAYDAPIDCAGYEGMVGNYDCMPRFDAERPVCIAGCCTSERVQGRATADEACNAIAEVYERDACTVFGPTFSVEQCLADVAEIESDPAQSRQLQIGLDCARSIASCADIAFCVAQFRGADHDETHD